jgi:hypothetical protein
MDSDDESDQLSTGSNGSSSTLHAAKTNHLDMQLRVMNGFITAAALQMCSYLQLLLMLCHLVPLLRSRDRKKRKRKPNVHQDQYSVIVFIHSWSDEMFKQQFPLIKGMIWKSIMLLLLEAVDHQFQTLCDTLNFKRCQLPRYDLVCC